MNKQLFSLMFRLAVVFFLLPICGCEKSEYYDDPDGQNPKETGGTEQGSASDNDDSPDDYDVDDYGNKVNEHAPSDTLTVAEFINLSDAADAFVKGYIVGDCSVSYSNADFLPPFSQPQAILLADSQGERDTGNMIAIQLKSGTNVRKHMNLVDNPKWWGRQVVFSGYRSTYLKMAGMKSISSYPTYDP